MKLFALFILILISLFNYSGATKQGILSNQEIREVLKCFGDLNLEEGCVICRYITQKIYKVLDISAMCPDIVETKLLNQRERDWRPDPQVINKWTVLYNLQKDYMGRILPQIQAMKGYDDIMHKKIIKEKAEKQNLANLIQFQNKVNSDLSKTGKEKENCDGSDQEINYLHNQVVGASKTQVTDIHDISQSKLDAANKSLLLNSMKDFLNKNNKFSFKEAPLKTVPDAKFVNEEMMNIDLNDPAVKSSLNFDKIVSGIKLNNGEKMEYLGTSVGSPYAGLQESNISEKLTKMNEEVGQPKISKATFLNKKITTKKIEENKIRKKKNENKNYESAFIQKSEVKKIKLEKNKHKNKFENNSEPILDENTMTEENNKILNPPLTSFMETSDVVSFDKNMFNNLVTKSNFNLETQRRGRRRSRFPDPQWDCAEAQIAKLVRYLCEEETSTAYQKYCKPIFEQINTMIESFLYHDNNIEICQNIHMCPVTVNV